MNQNVTKQFNFQKIINIFSILVLISLWVTVIIVYPKLPRSIPLKFNYNGKATETGPKYIFFALPTVATYLWGKTLANNQMGFLKINFFKNIPVIRILLQLVIFIVSFIIIKLIVAA